MSNEQIDVRAYAETRGISTAEAAAELGEQYEIDGPTVSSLGSPVATWPTPGSFGHNSGAQVTAPDASTLTMAARDKLKLIVARVNKLDEERKEVAGQIKDIYAEAKSMGYDTKALRVVIREMNMDRQEREERDAILDVYREALGMAD